MNSTEAWAFLNAEGEIQKVTMDSWEADRWRKYGYKVIRVRIEEVKDERG